MATILIADDTKTNRKFLGTLLQSFQHRIIEAQDGHEALLLAKQEHPDLIITDLLMPHMNGYEFVQKIRNDFDLVSTPVIFYSATYSKEEAQLLAEACDVQYVLPNPSDSELILKTVFAALSGTKAAAPEITRDQHAHDMVKDYVASLAVDLEKRTTYGNLFNQFADNFDDVFWQTTPSMDKILYISQAYQKIWGREVSTCYQNPGDWLLAVVPEDQQSVQQALEELKTGKVQQKQFSYRIRRTDNTVRHILTRANMVVAKNGQFEALFGISQDVTEREELRQYLETSLKEKSTLLKEVYHRVKNNLQIIYSLIELQAKSIHDNSFKEIFLATANRVRAISLVHEMLYQHNNLFYINMQAYVQQLLNNLRAIYQINPQKLEFVTEIAPIILNQSEATPCGLIINELITNACKHAFVNKKHGQIKLSLAIDNQTITLKIHDNGVGVNIKKLRNSNTLGMQLVYNLTRQLQGKIEFQQHHGLSVVLTFSQKATSQS